MQRTYKWTRLKRDYEMNEMHHLDKVISTHFSASQLFGDTMYRRPCNVVSSPKSRIWSYSKVRNAAAIPDLLLLLRGRQRLFDLQPLDIKVYSKYSY